MIKKLLVTSALLLSVVDSSYVNACNQSTSDQFTEDLEKDKKLPYSSPEMDQFTEDLEKDKKLPYSSPEMAQFRENLKKNKELIYSSDVKISVSMPQDNSEVLNSLSVKNLRFLTLNYTDTPTEIPSIFSNKLLLKSDRLKVVHIISHSESEELNNDLCKKLSSQYSKLKIIFQQPYSNNKKTPTHNDSIIISRYGSSLSFHQNKSTKNFFESAVFDLDSNYSIKSIRTISNPFFDYPINPFGIHKANIHETKTSPNSSQEKGRMDGIVLGIFS